MKSDKKIEIIKNLVIPDGEYFEDVIGKIFIEGFRQDGIEIAEVIHWNLVFIGENDFPLTATELSHILNRDCKVGIYIGKFSKSAIELAEKMRKSVILIDKKARMFGYIPTYIIKNVLSGWEVIKNEIVEK